MDEIMLPPRMFAAGDEPLGERVNSYHKVKTTRAILAALEPEELEFLLNSTFGRILAIDDNPPFSGVISLREFAIVTGCNCAKTPLKKTKKKNPLKEKLYWNELFGSLKYCTVETAIDMLRNKVFKTREARIKIAFLCVTSSILFASSHTPRIIPEHVELIRDLNEFLSFPWGRASYQTLASSLHGKDEIALSQTSVAIRGYVESIQLIMLAVIPHLKEKITHSERVVIVESDSDGESQPGGDTVAEDDIAADQWNTPPATKYCLIPGHAQNIDSECQVPVRSILDDPYEEWSAGFDFSWDDESEDLAVDNMVRLILEGFVFRKDMFKGGLNTIDLPRVRGEKKVKERELKGEGSSDLHDMISSTENRIYQALDAKFEKLASPSQQVPLFEDFDKKITDSIARQLKDLQDAIIKGVIDATSALLSSREVLPNTSKAIPVKGKEPSRLPFTTPAEAADSSINDVLRDLNGGLEGHLHANTEAGTDSLDEQAPILDDSQPEHPGEAVVGGSTVEEDDVTEQVDMDADDSAPMDQIVEVNTNTEHPEKRVEPGESVTGGPLAHMDQLVNADTTPEQVMN
ncbi:Uncharacterized protein Rs2_29142 [Raphanus sativus]|nr:Uncharacterized protein Rs2_29142 [Raphanus sativus]